MKPTRGIGLGNKNDFLRDMNQAKRDREAGHVGGTPENVKKRPKASINIDITKEKHSSNLGKPASVNAHIVQCVRTLLENANLESVTQKGIFEDLKKVGVDINKARGGKKFVSEVIRKLTLKLQEKKRQDEQEKKRQDEQLEALRQLQKERMRKNCENLEFKENDNDKEKQNYFQHTKEFQEEFQRRKQLQEELFRGKLKRPGEFQEQKRDSATKKKKRIRPGTVKTDPRVREVGELHEKALKFQEKGNFEEATQLYSNISYMCSMTDSIKSDVKHLVGRAKCYIELGKVFPALADLETIKTRKKGKVLYQLFKYEIILGIKLGEFGTLRRKISSAYKALQNEKCVIYFGEGEDKEAEEQILKQYTDDVKDGQEYLDKIKRNLKEGNNFTWSSESSVKALSTLSPLSPQVPILRAIDEKWEDFRKKLTSSQPPLVDSIKQALNRLPKVDSPWFSKLMGHVIFVCHNYSRVLNRSGFLTEAALWLNILKTELQERLYTTSDVCKGQFEEINKTRNLFSSLVEKKAKGNDLFRRGKYAESVKVFTEAIKLDNPNKVYLSILYCNRANANFQLKLYTSAIMDADASIRLRTDYVKPRLIKARSCVKIKDFNLAISEFEFARRYEDDATKIRKIDEEMAEAVKERDNVHYGSTDSSESSFGGSMPQGDTTGTPGTRRSRRPRTTRTRDQRFYEDFFGFGNGYGSYWNYTSSQSSQGSNSNSGFNFGGGNRSTEQNSNGQQRKRKAREGTSAYYKEILGLGAHAKYDACKKQYRRLSKQHHPDKGGDPDRMKEINGAWGELQRIFRLINK